MMPAPPARIWVLPAMDAPYAAVIRRKPARLTHVMRWNTRRNELEHGSWFRGRLFPHRSDISFDGKSMVYLARGASNQTWTGLCHLPYLTTSVHQGTGGTYYGGGYWADAKSLLWNSHVPEKIENCRYRIAEFDPVFTDDFGILLPRLARDGWLVATEPDTRPSRSNQPEFVPPGPPPGTCWQNKPTRAHPALLMQYLGQFPGGLRFRFVLKGYPEVLDDQVDCACWDYGKNLLFSRLGVLHRITLKELKSGQPGRQIDLEGLQRPLRERCPIPQEEGG